MVRTLTAFLLPALMFVVTPAATKAQFPPSRAAQAPDLSGTYRHSGGGTCYIEARGRSYIFENEKGERARFVWASPRRLEIVSTRGGWSPDVVATVGQDRFGRVVIRFTAPGADNGFWVSAG